MAEATVNGLRATLVALTLPRVGAWVADVELDSAEVLTGAASLAIDGQTWAGFVVRGGVFGGVWRGRIVGGAGGLSRVLPAIAQRGGTLGTALADVLRAAGETIAADAGSLSDVRGLWHRLAAPAQSAIADVASSAGFAWRVRADGRVWLGAETWPAFVPAGAVDVLEEFPEAGRLVLSGAIVDIAPGMTLTLPRGAPVRVGQVEIRATPAALRAVVYTEPEGERSTGLGAVVDAVVARISRRIDRLALYPSRVVSQSSSGLLDLLPDDPRVPSCSGVPIRYGLPGVRATVPSGARVLLTYEAGDPAHPVAVLWELGAVTQLVVNGGTARAARVGHATEDGGVAVAAVPVPGPPASTKLVITYTPPSGAPQQIIVEGLPPGVTANGSHALAGRITEGADVLRLP